MNKPTSAIHSKTTQSPPPWKLTPRWAGLIFALVGSVSLTAPAQALQFNFSYAPGITTNQMLGFEIAGKVWENAFADDVTVNLYIERTDSLGRNIIGGTLPGVVADYKYSDYLKKLDQDKTTNDDKQAVASLKKLGGGSYDGLAGNTLITDIQEVNLLRANAKAVGVISQNDTGLDGVILFSSLAGESVTWNYDFTSTVPTGTLDFLSTAIHEIGHNLGFASAVDSSGLIAIAQTGKTKASGKSLADNANALDLFRFTDDSIAKKAIDLSTNSSARENPFLSLDFGKTDLADLSNGKKYQASHWQQQDQSLGSLAPTLNQGQRQLLSSFDVTALDAIGWDAQVNPINLLTLQDQAKQKLATQLGVSLDWLNTNLATATVATPNQSLAVQSMIANSTIYPVGWGSGGRSWQQGLWEYINKETLAEQGITPPSASPESVPEPSGLFGLLGVAGLGLLTRLSKK